MAKPVITVAVAHNDRHVPIFDGTVTLADAELKPLIVGQSIRERDGGDRHSRMINHFEWDAAEVSLSSYLMARDRGRNITAIPVIPRRLFSPSLFFVRSDSSYRHPKDLEGTRVGIATYQTTLSVLAKGDLAHVYGADWKSITWVTNHGDILPFQPPDGVRVESVAPGDTAAGALLRGELEGLIMPHPPASIIGPGSKVRALFPDPRQAEEEYYNLRGYWPVMHLMALNPETVDNHPWLPAALYDLFNAAKQEASRHYLDPNWSTLVWNRFYIDAEQRLFGGDPWPHGVRANEKNLRDFMAYSREQGLIGRELSMEDLFHPSVLQT